MTAIDILGLEKTYSVGFWRKKPKCALRPLHLRVEEGEIFGFLGPNGAGKTTTLKMLMGLVYPTAGSARILDMEINDPRMKAQIGFLPEQPYFYDYLTAGELLDYYGQLSGVAPKERSRKVREVLDRVGLADVIRVQLRSRNGDSSRCRGHPGAWVGRWSSPHCREIRRGFLGCGLGRRSAVERCDDHIAIPRQLSDQRRNTGQSSPFLFGCMVRQARPPQRFAFLGSPNRGSYRIRDAPQIPARLPSLQGSTRPASALG